MKTAAMLWGEYCNINPNAPKVYDAWAFGDSGKMADELAALVVAGTKTATASSYLLYEYGNEPLPYKGLHNIILDGEENAVAIVETTEVEVMPFDEVSTEFACLEGEGDRTLDYWRKVHEDFFKRELASIDVIFDYKILVVCEKFQVVYK